LAGGFPARARRLTTEGGEVPFERIPLSVAIFASGRGAGAGRHSAAKATTLADFYAARLAGFLPGRPFCRACRGFRRPLTTLLDQFCEVRRFLGPRRKNRDDLV